MKKIPPKDKGKQIKLSKYIRKKMENLVPWYVEH